MSLVLQRLDFGNATLAGLPAYQQLNRLQSVFKRCCVFSRSSLVRPRYTTPSRAADRALFLSTRPPLPEWPGPVVLVPRFTTRVRPGSLSTPAFVVNVDARRPTAPFYCRRSCLPRCRGAVMEQFARMLSSLASFRRQLKTELFAQSFPDSNSSPAVCI